MCPCTTSLVAADEHFHRKEFGYQLEETARSSQENMDLSDSGWYWNVTEHFLGWLHLSWPWKRYTTVFEDYALMMMMIFRIIWVSWYKKVSILDFIGAKVARSGGDNWSYKMCKAQLNQQTNTQLVYTLHAVPVPTMSEHWRQKVSHCMGLLTPSSPRDVPTLSLTTKGTLLGRRLPSLSSALWCQYPIANNLCSAIIKILMN